MSKSTNRPISISKDKALKLAIQALESWAKYGEEMKKHGRGAECTTYATGYSTEYLIAMMKNSV